MERRTSRKNEEVRNVRTGMIFYERTKEQQFREKIARDASNGGDTNLRMELHSKICEAVRDGKSKEEVIEEISKEEKFKRYSQFFEKWTDHHLENYYKAMEGKLPANPMYNGKENRYTKNDGEAR